MTPPRAIRQRVRDALAAGGVVTLPTETVYGLAVRADDPRALERLRALKGAAARAASPGTSASARPSSASRAPRRWPCGWRSATGRDR